MSRQFIALFAAMLLVGVGAPLSAEEAKPVEGSLMMAGKTFKLAHVVAYNAKLSDEPVVAVIASDRPINANEIKKVLKENNGSDEGLFLSQPHVKVVFDKSGKASFCSAKASNFSTNTNGDALTGELKLDGNRVTGKAKLAQQGEGDFVRSFEFQFAAGLLGTAAEKPAQAAPLAKLGVSGTFKGNGKDAKLAFVSARPGEPFDDKPSLVLIFTEKDHSKDSNPKFNANFGKFGSALVISCHEDGSVFGCEVNHAAHGERRGFSAIGKIETLEFQVAGGQVQGQLTTNGPDEVFGQTWDVNLKFAAAYTPPAKKEETKPAAPTTTKPRTTTTEPKPETKPTTPAAAKLKVKDLAILQGVADVEYKKLVEHVGFKSDTNYKTLAAELAKKLDAQGWTKDGSDLIGVSAILKRKRGEASLTIFVKPADGGSTVTIFTEGLDWGE